MSADIIQFRDYQSKKDLARMYSEPTTLELMAVDVFAYAMTGAPEVVYESSLGYVDTAPSEYCAPMDDPA